MGDQEGVGVLCGEQLGQFEALVELHEFVHRRFPTMDFEISQGEPGSLGGIAGFDLLGLAAREASNGGLVGVAVEFVRAEGLGAHLSGVHLLIISSQFPFKPPTHGSHPRLEIIIYLKYLAWLLV